LQVVVDEVDIDGDDDLTSVYGLRIPVVLDPGGRVLAEGVIDDARALRKALRGGLGI
jgi:hypothetical protein